VQYTVDGGVARIALNRPESANAFDQPAAEALAVAVNRAAADGGVRAVLFCGNGKRFCAGGDLAAMAAADDRAQYVQKLATTVDRALRAMAAMPKPVVAAVQGAAAGAGVAAMLSADLAVAGESTRFAAAYPAVGLSPDCGFSRLVPRAIGEPRALQFVLSGRAVTAAEALAWGLIAEVVADDAVLARAAEWASTLAAGPVGAFGQSKRLIRSSWETSANAVGIDEAETIAKLSTGTEASGLIAAFLSR